MCKRSPVPARMAGSSRLALSLLLLLALLAGSEGSFLSSYDEHLHARCNEVIDGQYLCRCDVGYQPDGSYCLDIDECANDSTLCENGACVNKDGGYECDCDDGLVKSRDGRSCLTEYPVDEVEVTMGFDTIKIEWPQVSGRVEFYSVTWGPLGGQKSSQNTSLPLPKLRNGCYYMFHLKPGSGYEITVAAKFANFTKDLFTRESQTYPLIQSEMHISERTCTDYDYCDPTIIVEFTQTPRSASQFDKYRFGLEAVNTSARTTSRPAEAPGQTVEFSGLVPGRFYSITMWIVSGNLSSTNVENQLRLLPRPITHLKVTEVSTHHFSLKWDEPVGDYTFFQLTYYICKGFENPFECLDTFASSSDNVYTEIKNTQELGITVGQLQPHTMYVFNLVTCSGGIRKCVLPAVPSLVVTLGELPPAPYEFRVLSAQPRALNFSWQLDPVNIDGLLHRFLLEYSPTYDLEEKITLEFPPNARGGSVVGLVPGEYLFSVRAVTGACAVTGECAGLAARLLTRVDLEAPRVVRHSSTTVTVSFRVGYSMPRSRSDVNYSLVLAEQPYNDTPADLLWHDVRALDAWQLYRFNSSSIEEFTIGSEPCTADGRGNCTGPLKRGTTYYVKLRVYTTPDIYTDSAYTIFQTDTTIINNKTIIILAICATALILLVIIAAKKRCWIKYNQPGTSHLPTCTQRNPFYVNLLFREECAREIAEIEQRHYDETQENIYEEID